MKSPFRWLKISWLLRDLLVPSMLFFALLFLLADKTEAQTKSIGLFVGNADAYTCFQGLKEIELSQVKVGIFTEKDISSPRISAFVKEMDIAVVDIMQAQPAEWLLQNISMVKKDARIYAVRHSSRTKDYLDAGFIMDKEVKNYFKFTSAHNVANLILFLAKRDLGMAAQPLPPKIPPKNALYHPDAPDFFTRIEDYVSWYKQSGRYKENALWDLMVVFSTFPVAAKKEPMEALVRAYEANGINSVVWMQDMKDWDKALDRLISSPQLKGRLGSITGFTFKFSSTLTHNLLSVLKKADVPVFNAQYLFFSTGSEWWASEHGISPVGLPLQLSVPELSGLVEPTVIGVKEQVDISPDVSAYSYVPVEPLVQSLAKRVARWHRLKRMPNKEKKVVLIYYNHGAGKQNIGASYLNVARSIQEIIKAMKKDGYTIEGEISEEKITDLLIKSGRNIGSWAPDELERLLREGDVVKVPIDEYKKWYYETPIEFREKVEKDWGEPEGSNIMIHDGKFIIPWVKLGNLILAPQPSRGWGDDPEKLYHSTKLYPHHQYVAFYLWLQNQFKPDAMISLGTHGTHEWLPGKQTGLSHLCPPEVLIGEIPNLYPYIMDDVGEGIQAKRRGRGIIIDHATPPFKKGGLYEEYSTLSALISEYETTSSERIKEEKLKRIRKITRKLGLQEDLGIVNIDEGALEKIEHYLLALKTEMIPYGLHTFGVSPRGEGLDETAEAIAAKGEKDASYYKEQLLACGPSEMKSLLRGLKGGYIPPASGNDPIRNPESLPTGKNFYGFDPNKVPSKEAWTNGRKAAQEIIDSYKRKHGNAYPKQVGVVLWSVDTIRDQGIDVATALYLMGMKPMWDKKDKVVDVVPIEASELGRPRIDLLLQITGLFRDTFPSVILMLDKAVKRAAQLTDLENFIRKNSLTLEKQLIQEGRSEDEAKKLSLIRIYGPEPGAYGTKVDDMTGASGMWEDDDAVAEYGFINVQSFGYSTDTWGERNTPVYRKHLKRVDATVHSISSNLYSTMDNDDLFQYLGGLSMAVRKESARNPEVFISMQRTLGEGHVEPLSLTIGRELRSRYLNPSWIEGMKKENYAGAREMAEFIENMWGWQVTTPFAIDSTKWNQAYEVYVEDKYGLDIKEFFNKVNPWAYQSITSRMLESIRKGYWKADEKVKKDLAIDYAISVVEKGVACCDHTCNNPLLHQMVVGIISLPGLLSPEMVEKFRIAVEKAAGKALEEQVRERKAQIERLGAGLSKKIDPTRDGKKTKKQTLKKGTDENFVEGYKMEEVKKEDEHTEISTSGIQWFASLFVLLIILAFVFGSQLRKKL